MQKTGKDKKKRKGETYFFCDWIMLGVQIFRTLNISIWIDKHTQLRGVWNPVQHLLCEILMYARISWSVTLLRVRLVRRWLVPAEVRTGGCCCLAGPPENEPDPWLTGLCRQSTPMETKTRGPAGSLESSRFRNELYMRRAGPEQDEWVHCWPPLLLLQNCPGFSPRFVEDFYLFLGFRGPPSLKFTFSNKINAILHHFEPLLSPYLCPKRWKG